MELPTPTTGVKRAGLLGQQQALHFPTLMRSKWPANEHSVHYILNYSAAPVQVTYGFAEGRNLLSGEAVSGNGAVALPPWGVAVVEESGRWLDSTE